MAHGVQKIAAALGQKRQIEVRIGIIRVEAKRGSVVVFGAGEVALLVEEITQIVMRERIVGIDRNGAFVMPFRFRVLALAVINGSEINQRARSRCVQLGCPLISLNGFLIGAPVSSSARPCWK